MQPHFDIVARLEWGRDLDLQFGWRKNQEEPMPVCVKGIVLHHTEPSPSCNRLDEGACEERVRHWFQTHVREAGFSDIAYHYLVSPNGKIYEGRRKAGKTFAVGSHAKGNNESSLGLALMGDYRQEEPSLSALQSLFDILAWVIELEKIDVNESRAWNHVDRSGQSKEVWLPRLVGHSDIRETECPGSKLSAQISGLRERLTKADSTNKG